MFVGFNNERLTRAMEREYAMGFIDDPSKELGKYLKISLWNTLLESNDSYRAKRNAALAVKNSRGFVHLALEGLTEDERQSVDSNLVAKMLLVDEYNKYRQFTNSEDVSKCHEYASQPEYQKAFQSTKAKIGEWERIIKDLD